MTGRGAWPVSGLGGTKDYAKVRPGPYYTKGVRTEGGWLNKDINCRAVHGAVLAIQTALNRNLPSSSPLLVDGWFGPATERAVLSFQRLKRMTPWGGIGPDTARALFIAGVKGLATWPGLPNYDWAVTGLIYQESTWDPGAVGYYDLNDLGLAQINGPAHRSYSEQMRLDPDQAAKFINTYLRTALAEFEGNINDAIASYNLGLGGTHRWISQGRPDLYTPLGLTQPRDVSAYIRNVTDAPRA